MPLLFWGYVGDVVESRARFVPLGYTQAGSGGRLMYGMIYKHDLCCLGRIQLDVRNVASVRICGIIQDVLGDAMFM